MHIIFETERLIIRRYTPADGDLFYRIHQDEEVMRYIRPVKNREQADEFLAENLAFYEEHPLIGRWAMFHKSSNEFIGMFSVLPVDHSVDMHIGYALFPAFWGQGYASEALMGGVQYVFNVMQLPAIYAITQNDNTASQVVLLRNGFTETASIAGITEEGVCYFVKRNTNV